MHIFLSILNTLVPPASDCFLNPGIIDPRNDHDLNIISREIAHEEGIDLQKAESYLTCTPHNTYTQQRNTKKAVVKSPFCQFNKRLISDFRIKKGAEFYQNNIETLQTVSDKYHVDPYVITAIIGVESNYGKFTGSHPTKQALITIIANTQNDTTMSVGDETLHFNTVSKKQFFTDELKHLIHMHLHNNLDIDNLKGSWDGGIGLPQFMPSSYQRHAISPKNTLPDLFDPEDAIYSVANYLVERGKWQQGLIARKITPNAAQIKQLENQLSIPYNQDGTHLYRFLLDDDTSDYWVTYHNFDAIRTYNTRPHYALNILLLAQAIHDYRNT